MRNIFLPHAIEKPRVSMRAFVLGAVSLALAIIPGFAGAELKKSGNPLAGWHIYSEADSMTDELSCVALFNDKKRYSSLDTRWLLTIEGEEVSKVTSFGSM